jgi:hypothetical protein
MLKIITLAAVAALTLTAAVSPQPAYAHDGGAVAAGVIGGLAVGAIIGSQANRGYYNGGPGYYESGYQPAYSNCRIERESFVDGYGRYHTRRIRVCD